MSVKNWLGATFLGFLLTCAACAADEVKVCAVPEGASATCEQACKRLFEIGCRAGQSAEECLTLCNERTIDLEFSLKSRVLACYAQASDCVEVDGCGMTCGPMGSTIVFTGTDVDAGTLVDCTDDSLEEDDDTGSASPVGLPSSTSAALCPGDDDFFSFALTAGSSVSATATFSSGFLNVQILSSAGTLLSQSAEGVSPRSATHSASEDDTVFVRVTSASGGTPDYTLDLTTP